MSILRFSFPTTDHSATFARVVFADPERTLGQSIASHLTLAEPF